jgi:NADH dehydrogenase [ubiquinone] 1 alpha subcomplex assembly factor 7
VRDPFGTGGDFITAPDICQIFGELMGLWCVHVWAELGQPRGCRLVEMGPGRGALMADALRAASLVPAFINSVDVHLVETSPALRRAQEEHIRAQAEDHELKMPELFWHDRLEDVPDGPTFLIANEFLDALPIRQFQFRDGLWFERMVTFEELEGFVYTLADQPSREPEALSPIHKQAGEGDFLEICPGVVNVVAQIAERAARYPFAGLFIDYGYGEPAFGESFQAIKDHEFTDPLLEPGRADVTAHVDFSRVLQSAGKHGLCGTGPITQRNFLISLGVRERAAQIMQVQENMMSAHQFITGFQRLIEPDQMGTLFKVVALTGVDQPPVPGFEERPGIKGSLLGDEAK